jgi:MYXO-CTERM domain-containing protein
MGFDVRGPVMTPLPRSSLSSAVAAALLALANAASAVPLDHSFSGEPFLDAALGGTLDFNWRILVDPASPGGGVDTFRLSDFGDSVLTDADWRVDGQFNPLSPPDGAIDFLFQDPPVPPGPEGSRFFFLHTNATASAQTAFDDLLGEPEPTLSGTFNTFAPAAPEPSVLLTVLGLAALGLMIRRRSGRD